MLLDTRRHTEDLLPYTTPTQAETWWLRIVLATVITGNLRHIYLNWGCLSYSTSPIQTEMWQLRIFLATLGNLGGYWLQQIQKMRDIIFQVKGQLYNGAIFAEHFVGAWTIYILNPLEISLKKAQLNKKIISRRLYICDSLLFIISWFETVKCH